MTGIRIPANIDRPDKLIGGLTGRQLTILSITGLGLYGAWSASRPVLPTLLFMVLALPVGITSAILALGQRDGLSLDRMLVAAIRQRLLPRHQVAAPEGIRPIPDWLTSRITHTGDADQGDGQALHEISPAPLRIPAEGVSDGDFDIGVIDLGPDGMALVAVCSTVNFALRTPIEQEALVAAFARYLHSLSAPVQVLVRTERLDLSTQIAELREVAGGLPHPALEQAALEHADYLDQLRHTTDLLRRQVLAVLREPVYGYGRAAGPQGALGRRPPLSGVTTRRTPRRTGEFADPDRHAAEARLARRLNEAMELLRPAGITVTPLDTGQATAVLATCCDPDSLIPPSANLAGAEEVITSVLATPPVPDTGLLRNQWYDPMVEDESDMRDEPPPSADIARGTRWRAGHGLAYRTNDEANLGGRDGRGVTSDIEDAFTGRDAA